MQLILIRHAQSQNNALPESERIADPGITDRGVQQARRLADRLADEKMDVLLVSAFRRALQTMQFVASRREQPVTIWTELFEQGGCYSGHIDLQGAPGMSRSEIESAYPNFDVAEDIGEDGWWKSQPYESWDAAIQRAKRIVERLTTEFGKSNQTVACVIHADIKALLLDELLGDGHPEWQGSANLLNTGVTKLQYAGKQFEMPLFNDSSHLSDDLKT